MALDQYEPLLEKERVVTEDFEAVSKQEREKRHRFNEVKHKRKSFICLRQPHCTADNRN